MRGIYRFCTALAIAFMLLFPSVASASDVSDALWKGDVRITNSGTDTATGVSVNASINSTALINNVFANTTLSDIATLYSGSDAVCMPGYDDNPWIFWVNSIGSNLNIDYDLYMGGASGGLIRYFPDTTGMVVSDNSALEPSGNFTLEQSVYLDTTAVSNTDLVYKEGVFRTYVSGSGNITARIATYPSANLRYSSDAEATISTTDWVKYKEITLTDGADNVTIKFDVKSLDAGVPCSARVYLNGVAIGTIQQGLTTSYVTKTEDLALDADTGDLVQLYGKEGGAGKAGYLQNFRIYYDGGVETTATSVTSGEHTVQTSMDSPFLGIAVDTDVVLPVTANLTLNAPLWQTDLNANPFTTIDDNEFSCDVSDATWVEDEGYSFDGVNDYINCGDDVALDLTTSYTILAWVKPAVVGATMHVAGRDSGAIRNFTLIITSAGKASFQNWVTTVNAACSGSTTLLADNWYCLAGTYDNSNLKVYLNGVADAAPVAQTGTTDNGDVSLTIGVRDNDFDRDYNGIIGEVKIYNRALPPTEILQNYNATKWKYDGSTDRSMVSTLVTVPDNANDWTFCENGAVPYMEYTKMWVGGVPKAYWAWRHAATFTDSWNSYTATPSFRTTSSDADVSASLISFEPISQSKIDTFSLSSIYSILTGTPDTPGGMYTELDFGNLPVAPISEILDEASVPQAAWWFPFLFFGIGIIGLIVYGGTTTIRGPTGKLHEGQIDGSLLMMFMVTEALLVVLGKMGPLPLWPAYLYPIAGIALVLSKKHFSWG